ncbi:hypothetical protein F4778DRAFT_722317 [Xylariomycetidae sp. FL2044]|nr:hypothetical protein F4778DRAFT_722317 [Xylariomycetidae sp. FL2044]
MAPATVSVIYPAGTKFDMDYYLATHMPLVQAKWAPFGLKGWKVAHYTNEDAPYCVQAIMEWEDASNWAKASGGQEAKEIFDDVAKFSDKKPSVLVGEIKASKTC